MRQLISNGEATNDAPEDVENDFSYADLDSACDSVDAFMETPVDIAEDQQFLNLENVNHADYPYHAGKNGAEVMDGNSAYPTVERMSTLWLEKCNSFEDSAQEDELPDVNPVLAIAN